MRIRIIAAAGALALAVLLPAVAEASVFGVARTNVNMRTGPGVSFARITVVPAGAPIRVFDCGSWCRVSYSGAVGWVSARYIASEFPRPSRYVVRRQWGPYYGDPGRYAYPYWRRSPNWYWGRPGWNFWFGF